MGKNGLDQMLEYLAYGDSKLEEAIDIFNELIEDENIDNAIRSLAIFHNTLIDYGYGVEAVEYHFDANVKKEQYFLLLIDAITNFRLGDFEKAVEQFQQFISCYPSSGIPHFFLAAIYSDPLFRDEEKMMSHINKLDEWDYFDIMVSDVPVLGLPTIYVIPKGKSAIETTFEATTELAKKRQSEKKLEEDLREKNKEISLLVKELRRLNENNRKMVERYSHNWTNLLVPEKVLNVIHVLKDYPEFKKESQTLLDAYNQEVLLQQQSRMLEIRHSGDADEMKRYIRKGRLSVRQVERERENAASPVDIFNHVLQRILFRLLFNEYDARANYVQEKLVKAGFKLEQLRDLYNNHFFFEQSNWLAWLNDNIFPLVVEMNEDWEKVFVRKKSGAAAFVDEILSEFILNVFTYGSLSSKDVKKISFETEEVKGEKFLTVSITNEIDPDNRFTAGTKSGLSSMKSLLNMVNFDNADADLDKNLEISQDDKVFHVKIIILHGLLYKRQRTRGRS